MKSVASIELFELGSALSLGVMVEPAKQDVVIKCTFQCGHRKIIPLVL